jgi:hypothetical protein
MTGFATFPYAGMVLCSSHDLLPHVGTAGSQVLVPTWEGGMPSIDAIADVMTISCPGPGCVGMTQVELRVYPAGTV